MRGEMRRQRERPVTRLSSSSPAVLMLGCEVCTGIFPSSAVLAVGGGGMVSLMGARGRANTRASEAHSSTT